MSVQTEGAKVRVQTWRVGFDGDALDELLGLAWPRRVGTVAQGRYRVLCIGPTDWLAFGGADTAETLMHSISRAAVALSIVDVSHALRTVRLEGNQVREILSAGCGLDLHPRAFGGGQCARTRLAQVPVIIECTGNPPRFACHVARSYAAYLESWLQDAATAAGSVACWSVSKEDRPP